MLHAESAAHSRCGGGGGGQKHVFMEHCIASTRAEACYGACHSEGEGCAGGESSTPGEHRWGGTLLVVDVTAVNDLDTRAVA